MRRVWDELALAHRIADGLEERLHFDWIGLRRAGLARCPAAAPAHRSFELGLAHVRAALDVEPFRLLVELVARRRRPACLVPSESWRTVKPSNQSADAFVVARRSGGRAISGAGLVRALARVGIGLVLGALIYTGLVEAGLVRSALAPRVDGDIALARGDRPGLRVLFVGNSFTYYNSMPALVHELAEGDEGAPPIFTVEYAAPNWTLRKASQNDGLADLLEDARWDVVVLQEVSWLPATSPEVRRRYMYPFVRSLDRDIAAAGAQTVLFMTWGYKDGAYPGDTFDGMQARLAEGYSELGGELFAPVAPVGLAWQEALRREPGLDLWKRDGHHPSRSGSYLAACVFYAVLSGRDPSGSDFTAGMDATEASFLQLVAFDIARVTEAYAAAK